MCIRSQFPGLDIGGAADGMRQRSSSSYRTAGVVVVDPKLETVVF